MSANAEPGPSKHMSVEQEARDANKSFWELSQELEEVEAAEAASVATMPTMSKRVGRTTPKPPMQLLVVAMRMTPPPPTVATTRMVVVAATRPLRSRRNKGGIGHRKCSPTSQTRSLRSRQVAYQWRLRSLPKGTACN